MIAPPPSFVVGMDSVAWVDMVTDQVEVHFGERYGDTGYLTHRYPLQHAATVSGARRA